MPHDLPRRYMVAPLVEQALAACSGLRAPVGADMPALGSLLYHAYRDTVDYEGEDEPMALAEVRKTFTGEYGAFVPECSRVVDRDGVLVSATLVTRWQERPFIAHTMTLPQHTRSGLARACMVAAMQCLRATGEAELRLVVTLANTAARSLYESLGFVVQE